jgi:hypothetical protein
MNDNAIDASELSDNAVVAYFGYGSLVCRATHRTDILAAVPARLKGWRRHWRPRPDMPGFPAALLSVRQDESSICDGLLVFDRAENLAAVDAREARYRRIEIADGDLELLATAPYRCLTYVYVAEDHLPPHPEPPRILRSYLDAVLLGFVSEHGEEGLARFLAETEGFEVGIHDDRADPIYPRSVSLDDAHRRRFDDVLSGRGLIAVETWTNAG